MTSGKIIVLNGTSSSGKSTTAKALQNLLDEPYLHIGIDTFIFALPKRYLNQPLWSEVFDYTLKDGRIEAITAGLRGHQLFSAMHHSLRTLALLGQNIVVDHVLLEPAWVDECAALFDSLDAWSIGIKCRLDVLEQREKDRKDRTLGAAQAQFNVVHAYCRYDFEVDTSLATAAECAQQIKDYLATHPIPTAFQQMKRNAAG